MNYDKVRDEVLRRLDEKSHGFYKRQAIEHMFHVSSFSYILAKKRGLDTNICQIAGLLHDISVPFDMNTFNHASRSADIAQDILQTLSFKQEDIELITTMIRNHSLKDMIHDDYSECLKDADVYAHYIENHDKKHINRIKELPL